MNAPLHISDEDGIRILKELAAERPDYVYDYYDYGDEEGDRLCLYRLPTGEPGCIVGHLIERVRSGALEGLFPETTSYDGDGNPTTNGQLVRTLHDKALLSASPELIAILECVQNEQDAYVPWGEAVDEALRIHGEPQSA